MPKFYNIDPNFNHNKIRLMQVQGYQGYKITEYLKYITHKESDFTFYRPELQQTKHHAPTVLYHLYKNSYDETQYIGIIEYDIEFKICQKTAKKIGLKIPQIESLTSFIDENIKEGRVIAFSSRWKLKELSYQQNVRIGKQDWLNFFIDEYNKFYGAKLTRKDLLKENPIIPCQQSFLCDISSFRKIMEFIVHLIDSNKLNGASPRPSTVLERYIGLCIHLSGLEIIHLTLRHANHHNYKI